MELPAGEISVGTFGSRVCICVRGRATQLHGSPLREFVEEMLHRGYDRFQLDLGRCTYLDSSFLGVLVSLSARLAEAGFSRWSVYRISPRNLEVITKAGLDRFFEMPDAMAYIPAKSSDLRPLVPARRPDEGRVDTVVAAAPRTRATERIEPRFKDLSDYLRPPRRLSGTKASAEQAALAGH